MKTETPLMKQYNEIKGKYPMALLLFRVGDFYELFGADAIKASKILGITLTKRHNGSANEIELAGFPHHSLDTYLPKLVRAGERVAICDQLEDPKQTKTIVKRGVTELVTPGVSFSDKILDHKSNNFLASVHFTKKEAGVAFLDISTGEFLVAQGNFEYIDKLLQSFAPSEVIFQRNRNQEFVDLFGGKFYTYTLDDWIFTEDFGLDTLLKHFETKTLKGFGIQDQSLAIVAAGAALKYLADTQHDKVQHISSISRIEEDKYVWLDRFTIRNLELLYSPNEGAKTLLDVLDQTVSPMGSRMMKRWIALPLKDEQPIRERLKAVEGFVEHEEICDELRSHLNQMGDLERLISKVAVGRVNPREVVQLKRALDAIVPVKEICSSNKVKGLLNFSDQLNPCAQIADRIRKELEEDPPVLVSKGRVIAEGVNQELDKLRGLAYSGKDYLLKIQERETERTGISSLKIAFNNVFGYYIEVRNTHKDKVPEDWIRKQTLVSAERYITEELKEYESKILGAEERILELENKLFNDLVLSLADYVVPIQLNASILGRLDCLLSFAKVAIENHYVCPEINNSKIIDIREGRHPVIEMQLPIGEEYVSNDVYLDNESQQLIMITGPNMAGKSALLRQTALIVLMAQMGSFVPAKEAKIGLVDKVFTRVGASDNISQGESTFMVEMNETASILNNLSDRSLVLLDEIGRGTSTYDGVSIAWAIAEYIHEYQGGKAKTLFATHYHELNEMYKEFSRIKNYNVSVKELGGKVVFLRKLVEGGSNHSFGIHVAKMAGIPKIAIDRANKVLLQLEQGRYRGDVVVQPKEQFVSAKQKQKSRTSEVSGEDKYQLSFFQLDDPVLVQIKDELINIDINTLTPVEALMKLNEIKKLVGGA